MMFKVDNEDNLKKSVFSVMRIMSKQQDRPRPIEKEDDVESTNQWPLRIKKIKAKDYKIGDMNNCHRHLYMKEASNRMAASMINSARTRQSIEELCSIDPQNNKPTVKHPSIRMIKS